MRVEQILQECQQNSITVASSSSVTVPSSSKVTVTDAVVFVQGRRIVGKLDAVYDFAKIDPSLHTLAVQIIMQQRVQLGMHVPKDEAEREKKHEKRLAEYNALPWWKRIFKRKPWKYDP